MTFIALITDISVFSIMNYIAIMLQDSNLDIRVPHYQSESVIYPSESHLFATVDWHKRT